MSQGTPGLPDNWEWDYDGTRWIFRYKPTGLIRYNFPKPGDEFPDEFIDDGAPAPDLAPEEMLISQKQRRRSTVGVDDSSKSRRKEGKSSFIIEEDDGVGEYWDQPDALMYMGPGAYTDISPLQEDDEIRQEDVKADQKPPVAATGVPPQKATEQFERIHISPLVSAETTPLVIKSQPVVATPEIDSVSIVGTSNIVVVAEAHPPPVKAPPAPVEAPSAPVEAPSAPVEAPAEPALAPAAVLSPTVPLLDSRQIPYTPVGFVAELPSELTAQCHEEIFPTPVELPGNEIMTDTNTQPVVFHNAFPLAPAELHSEALPPSRIPQQNAAEPKSLAFRTAELDSQRQNIHQQDPSVPRPAPLRQNSMPQTGNGGHSHPFNVAVEPAQGKFKPYNPGLGTVSEENDKAPAAASSSASFSISQHHVPGNNVENKRHSLAGPPPSSYQNSAVPPILQPFKAWKPLPPAEESEQPVQGDGPSGPTRFPSVLQPARGRFNIAQSPPSVQSPPGTQSPPHTQSPPYIRSPPYMQSPPASQQGDNNQRYQPYKPATSIHQMLDQDIETTIDELSKTAYNYSHPSGTTTGSISSEPERPGISRASTLPVDLPALPYMGFRPQMPQSGPNAPGALRTTASYQTFTHHHTASVPPSGHQSSQGSQSYSAPIQSVNPDMPPPLKIARNKSPPPTNNSNLPPVSASLRPPASTEEYVVSRETTPAPPDSTHSTQMTPSPYKLPELSFEANERRHEAQSTQNKQTEEIKSVAVVESKPLTQPVAALNTHTAPIQSRVYGQSSSSGPGPVFLQNQGPNTAPPAGPGHQHIGLQNYSSPQPLAPGATSNPSFQTEPSGHGGYNRPQTPPGQNAILAGRPSGFGNPGGFEVSPPEAPNLEQNSYFRSSSIDVAVESGIPPPRPPKTPHEPSPLSSPGDNTSARQQDSPNAPPLPSIPLKFEGEGSISRPVTTSPSLSRPSETTYSTTPYSPPPSHGPSSLPAAVNMSQYQTLGSQNQVGPGQQQSSSGPYQNSQPNVAPPSSQGPPSTLQNWQWQGGPNNRPSQIHSAGASTTSNNNAPGPAQTSPPSSMAPQFRPQDVTVHGPGNQQLMQPIGGHFQPPEGSFPQTYSSPGPLPAQPPPMPTPPGQAPGSFMQRVSTMQIPMQQGPPTHSNQFPHSGAPGAAPPQGQTMLMNPNSTGPTKPGSGVGDGQFRPVQSSQQPFHSQPNMQQHTSIQQRPPVQHQPQLLQQQNQPLQQQRPPQQQHPTQQQQQRPPQQQHPTQQQHSIQQQHSTQQQAGPQHGPSVMMPPQNQGQGGSHPPPSAAPPAQEEKGWLGGLGKLLRNGTLRKHSSAGGSSQSASNKLHKLPPQGGAQQAQGPQQNLMNPGALGQPTYPGMPPMQQSPSGRQPGYTAQLPSQQQQQHHQQQRYSLQQPQQQQSGMMMHGRNSSVGGPVQGGSFYSQQPGPSSGRSSRVSSQSSSTAGPGSQTKPGNGNSNNNNGWGKSGGYDGEGWGGAGFD